MSRSIGVAPNNTDASARDGTGGSAGQVGTGGSSVGGQDGTGGMSGSGGSTGGAPAFAVVALTDDGSLLFTRTDELSTVALKPIVGTFPNTSVLGMDLRPSDGRLYLLSTGDLTYVVTSINEFNVQVTKKKSFQTPVINGTNQAIDFNPLADRMTLTNTDTGASFQINVDNGQINFWKWVTFAAGDPNADKTPRVVACAYTSNTKETPAATQLYTLDSVLDVLTLQDPNSAVLHTIGALGIDIGDTAAFDIVSVTSGGSTLTYGYVLDAGSLYTIDLLTGKTGLVGKINTSLGLRGLVVQPL